VTIHTETRQRYLNTWGSVHWTDSWKKGVLKEEKRIKLAVLNSRSAEVKL